MCHLFAVTYWLNEIRFGSFAGDVDISDVWRKRSGTSISTGGRVWAGDCCTPLWRRFRWIHHHVRQPASGSTTSFAQEPCNGGELQGCLRNYYNQWCPFSTGLRGVLSPSCDCTCTSCRAWVQDITYNGWDCMEVSMRHQLKALLTSLKPKMLVLSPPCTMFSALTRTRGQGDWFNVCVWTICTDVKLPLFGWWLYFVFFRFWIILAGGQWISFHPLPNEDGGLRLWYRDWSSRRTCNFSHFIVNGNRLSQVPACRFSVFQLHLNLLQNFGVNRFQSTVRFSQSELLPISSDRTVAFCKDKERTSSTLVFLTCHPFSPVRL